MNNALNYLLCALHISSYRPKVKDRKLSKDFAAEHTTDENAVDVLKNLFPGNTFPELSKVLKLLSDTYRICYEITVTYDNNGLRFLPFANAEKHREQVKLAEDSLPMLLDDLVAGYPAALLRAKQALNGTFKASDYMTASQLRDRFSVSCEYFAPEQKLPDGSMPTAILDIINSQVDARTASHIENANNDLWTRIYKVVGAFQKAMADPAKQRFHDSLLENVSEVCGLLKTLNVGNNPDLENMRATLEKQIASLQMDTLKDSENARKDAASKATEILTEVARKVTFVKKAVPINAEAVNATA
jgi:hypothetical protein